MYLPGVAAEALKALKRADVVSVKHVFLKPDGEALDKHGLEYRWKLVRAEAGLTDFHWHDLRHSCASFLAQRGASLLEIERARTQEPERDAAVRAPGRRRGGHRPRRARREAPGQLVTTHHALEPLLELEIASLPLKDQRTCRAFFARSVTCRRRTSTAAPLPDKLSDAIEAGIAITSSAGCATRGPSR